MKYTGLLFWVVLECGLCFMPGPGYWQERPQEPAMEISASSGGSFFSITEAYRLVTGNPVLKNLLGHFLPMAGVGFCLTGLLRSRIRRGWTAAALSLSTVGVLALIIELLQEMLPEHFNRMFSLTDIGFALLGGGLGAWGCACTHGGLLLLQGLPGAIKGGKRRPRP